MTDITAHPLWPELRTYVHIERYDRAKNANDPVRLRRLEVKRLPQDTAVRDRLLSIVIECAACGKPIHPLRQRKGQASYYLAFTCLMEHGLSCSRGSHRSDNHVRIVADLDGPPAA